jgi:hypothetical protein
MLRSALSTPRRTFKHLEKEEKRLEGICMALVL